MIHLEVTKDIKAKMFGLHISKAGEYINKVTHKFRYILFDTYEDIELANFTQDQESVENGFRLTLEAMHPETKEMLGYLEININYVKEVKNEKVEDTE